MDSLQGKPTRKPGRYNSLETISMPTHLRWPNEGFNGNSSKKHILYDELSIPQWVTVQLTNIYHIYHKGSYIQNSNITKQGHSGPLQSKPSQGTNMCTLDLLPCKKQTISGDNTLGASSRIVDKNCDNVSVLAMDEYHHKFQNDI